MCFTVWAWLMQSQWLTRSVRHTLFDDQWCRYQDSMLALFNSNLRHLCAVSWQLVVCLLACLPAGIILCCLPVRDVEAVSNQLQLRKGGVQDWGITCTKASAQACVTKTKQSRISWHQNSCQLTYNGQLGFVGFDIGRWSCVSHDGLYDSYDRFSTFKIDTNLPETSHALHVCTAVAQSAGRCGCCSTISAPWGAQGTWRAKSHRALAVEELNSIQGHGGALWSNLSKHSSA